LQGKRQRVDNCHQGNPDCPGGEQGGNDFVAVMFPREKIANYEDPDDWGVLAGRKESRKTLE
jgi:hypothetical protein